jgi:hypothetical protein
VLGTARCVVCQILFHENGLNYPHAKVSDDNVRRWVLCAVQDVLWSAEKPPVNRLTGEKNAAAYLRSRCTISWSCKYFTPDSMELEKKVNGLQ